MHGARFSGHPCPPPPMSASPLKLKNPPIVEAVLDIECDNPPGFEVSTVEEAARNVFLETYPKLRTQFMQRHQLKMSEEPELSVERMVQALQFRTDDERQLVQVRKDGYSFNRLAPYTSLGEYLSEIERTWRLYINIVHPLQITAVRLRYINRLELPAINGALQLSDYLKVSPQLPAAAKLVFAGFINQHSAREVGTGNEADIILASEPGSDDCYPVVFDITVAKGEASEPSNWPWILDAIESLRSLKNRIFEHTLTEPCLNRYRH